MNNTNVSQFSSVYQWESFHKSWESVQETRSGRLTIINNGESQSLKITKKSSQLKRGLQRSLCVIVDNSSCMCDRLHLLDYSQPRSSPASTGLLYISLFFAIVLLCLKFRIVSWFLPSVALKQCEEVLSEFVTQFFTENPLSQLQFICTFNKIAAVVTPLSGNRTQQLEGVSKACTRAEGEPSLQNALLVAHSTLSYVALFQYFIAIILKKIQWEKFLTGCF